MSNKNVVMVLTLAVIIFSTVSAFAERTCEAPANGDGATIINEENEEVLLPYAFDQVASPVVNGTNSSQYYIFEPVQGANRKPLPVIAFLHGYNLNATPEPNQAFIDHLVKRGHIVIWPKYMACVWNSEERQCEEEESFPAYYASHAAAAIRAALDYIEDHPDSHAQPVFKEEDGQRFEKLALIGHSAGGITVANIAANYGDYGLPAPVAVVAMHPGEGGNRGPASIVPISNDPEHPAPLPRKTYLLVIAGDVDTDSGADGDRIWDIAGDIENTDKDWILVTSDRRTILKNRLIANHMNPQGIPGNQYMPLNCHDWYGYWKWATALCQLGFAGEDGPNSAYYRERALGVSSTNREKQSFMGLWTDENGVVFDEVHRAIIGDEVNQPQP